MNTVTTNHRKVIIADDHPVFREALNQLVARSGGLVEHSASVGSFDDLRRCFGAHPDTGLVLLDLEMPGAEGFSALTYLCYHYPATRVAIVSGHEDPQTVRRAIDLGARAYIPKSLPLPQLMTVLRDVINGDSWYPPVALEPAAPRFDDGAGKLGEIVRCLSAQQRRVFLGLAEGKLNKQIAGEMGITEGTVKGHVTGLLKQLGVSRRTQAALLAQRIFSRPDRLGPSLDEPAQRPN